MNQNILELALVAGFGVRENGSEVYTSKLEHLPITEEVEKFAELVALQCISWINDNVGYIDAAAKQDLINYLKTN